MDGRRWKFSGALAKQRVQLIRIEQRVLVYYDRSLVREFDPFTQRFAAADRWVN